jgi:hypothetical protein
MPLTISCFKVWTTCRYSGDTSAEDRGVRRAIRSTIELDDEDLSID